MAFSSAITKKTVFGNKKIVFGTYTNAAADMGGDITTGLTVCEYFSIQRSGTAATAAVANVVNETLPVAGGVMTIVTAAYEPGTWMAIGY